MPLLLRSTIGTWKGSSCSRIADIPPHSFDCWSLIVSSTTSVIRTISRKTETTQNICHEFKQLKKGTIGAVASWHIDQVVVREVRVTRISISSTSIINSSRVPNPILGSFFKPLFFHSKSSSLTRNEDSCRAGYIRPLAWVTSMAESSAFSLL